MDRDGVNTAPDASSGAELAALLSALQEGFARGEVLPAATGHPADFRLLEANDAFFRHTGLRRDILGRPAREWATPCGAHWRECFCRVAAGGGAESFTECNLDSGAYYEVQCASPAPGQFALLLRDVSEQLQLERTLHERERFLREVLASLPAMVWTADAAGVCDFVSPQWEVYTGLPAARLQGHGWLEVLHPDDRAGARAVWDEAVAAGTAYAVEYRLRRHDGAYRWFLARGTPVMHAQGRVQCWFGSCTDVHALKRSQEALREAERRYSALFNNRLNGMVHLRVLTDAAGQPVDLVYEAVNEAYERIVGRRRSEVLGRRVREVFPGIENLEPDLISLYGGIALHGGETSLELLFPLTGQWFSIYVYSHAPGRCTLLFNDISAQKAAEARLRESEADLRALFDQAAVGMARLDHDGRFLKVNRRLCEMTGYCAEELEGLSFADLSLRPDRDLGAAELARCLRGEMADFAVEKRCRRRDGQLLWVRITVSGVRDAGGEVRHGVAVLEDITARRHAQAELESFFRQAAVGMAVVDTEGRLRRVNQRLCEITGYSEEELTATTFQALTHPDDLAGNEALFRRLLAGEIGEYTLEKRYRRKQGGYVWAALSVALVRNDGSERPYVVTVVQDIEARKRLEAELREAHQQLERRVEARTAELRQALAALRASEARSRLVLETATDAYVATDESGRILEWNHAAERLFGWPRQTVLGRALAEVLVPPRYRAQHTHSFARFTQTGVAEVMNHPVALPALHRHGHELPVELSLTANRIQGRWVISAFLRDIRERKRQEEALQAALHEAEQARARAEEAQLQAEAANRAKSEFLATMSHEIRTPLNGVIGFNVLLLDSPLSPEQRRYVELARQSGEALLHLLNDFLDFSKIEAGRLELEPLDFSLPEEIHHVLALIEAGARDKGLALTHSINAPGHLRGDAARLRQVLLNLLSNAVKFTEQGEVHLCCEEVLRTGETVWICFQVQDTGIGIDPSARDRLFQPFVQADASTTRRYGGTGLGLAICKRLVVAMGGKIGYRSVVGEGSTFWFELPFRLQERREATAAEAAPLPACPEGTPRGRVLVVEDNPVSQLLATEILRRLGCQVDVAGNGREAVEAFRRLPYDLIFMDCDMPVMNGYDATCEIRALAQPGEHVPIIAMTASVLQGDVERCIGVGMDDFMSKPLRLPQLAAMVDKWMKKPRA